MANRDRSEQERMSRDRLVAELRRRMPSMASASDEEVLRVTAGTSVRAWAEFEIARDTCWKAVSEQLELDRLRRIPPAVFIGLAVVAILIIFFAPVQQ